MHDDSHPAAAHHGDHGVAKYLYVFLALCVLTGASFFTYSQAWPFGKHEAWVFMMAVSSTKAMLVILFFMHLKYEADWKYVLTIPASIMSLLLILALVPDIGMRVRKYSPERKRFAAEPRAQFEELQTQARKEMRHDAGGH